MTARLTPYRFSLDLQLFSQEKTESATPKKRQEAREKGQVAKSQELPGAFILLFVFMSFYMIGPYYKSRILAMFGDLFEDWLTLDLTMGNVMSLFTQLMYEMLMMLAPIFAIALLVALLGNYVQVGILFTGDPLKMKFSKLSPIQGFKNIFAMRTVVEFIKNILKLVVIGLVVFMTLKSQWGRIIQLDTLPVEYVLGFTGGIALKLGIEIGVILVVLALGDYFYKKYEYEKGLRMSKQDIKDEFKKTEGNPLIKGRIRERQRKMALQRMMQDVPKADVIITNPTHFAVALKYDASKMEAPVVLAKGMDHVALRIRETAKEHGVITMENKPLARALYDRSEIGDSIPSDLFQAVAEVLAYVYKLKGRVKSS
ncbi:flagellar biosynthetic protein FlhB [Paenibacillus curdlanolyticus YK9]|uniref:Flagellar biosynthetic protein FlhB n=1 Tax=Paenibacillus curdlanolyticus YK9 TaxID=717606 RepID=E0I459_9BACL|nr:flagellar biosynthesis protein FlhB [Paenibacillus curdlanolyticus]EFM13073.1 flagellar biosynthetic protein FlhB [Paenibacillus curdlanolyticus YK9]